MTLEAPSLDLLLFDWLGELIFLKDSERLVFTRVAVDVKHGAPCRLHARLRRRTSSTAGAPRSAPTRRP